MNKYYTGYWGLNRKRESWLDGRLTINPHQVLPQLGSVRTRILDPY